ncbi:MAG TPA: thioredoxin domain-containing protein [Acidimicrobiales bacterium]|nr:thioredoxin domain-containing protein [Acidimicrobiales bacterium]
MNHLADETSPYLRQHRDNPVDWYPWGETAFNAARERDCPVLLSVGYSACHWCHVMAHESFEDEATAALLNERFVSVKVDREERPDVDGVYMEAVQALTGQGGWPMTVFLTPDGRPFFGGTYFPRHEVRGLPTFTAVLQAVDTAWRDRRPEVLDQAAALSRTIDARTRIPGTNGGEAPSGDGTPPESGPVAPEVAEPGTPEFGGVDAEELLDRAFSSLQGAHDDRAGGFGGAPKFPQPGLLEVVARTHLRHGDPGSLAILTTTLDAMASGGIYDHLGGGFARYSVDASWTVPHFEKMLYDQAGLARVYLHAWQLTGEPRWGQVVDETISYVLGDLATPEGGLCSAEDADSEGQEGRFYVWRPEQVAAAVGPDLAEAAMAWWGVTPEGNFEGGTTILHRTERGALLRPPEIEEARRLLAAARATRVRPGRDDKVLTEWNAMFLATLAEAAAATGREDWRAAAVRLGEFLLHSLRRDDGRWLRSWQGGRARHLAYAADYAWLIEAFTRLAELTGQARWITLAGETADALLALFWDDQEGGLFTTGDDAERLIVRAKDVTDGATPSAGSVAAVALTRLGALTGERRYTDTALTLLRLLGPVLAAQPLAVAHALQAVDLAQAGITEVAVVGDQDELVRVVQQRWLPGTVLAWGEPYPSPLWEARPAGAAYVCRQYTCGPPARTPGELASQLDAA